MQIIGLTGGIGTGKSTASGYLREQGFAVIDADQIAREIVEPGQPLLKELGRLFGEEIINEDGSLNRKGLAAIVFQNKERREALDKIMHGRIIEVIDERIDCYQRQGACRGIILDAPLLFETGLEKKCDQVLLITADTELRIARVCARDGMTPEEVSARIKNQMGDQEKKAKADWTLDNSGSKEALLEKLDELFSNL